MIPQFMPSCSARLEDLRTQKRKPGEASFFFYDSHFKNEAVKVLPGEYFVSTEDILILTTLGSCITACLWDRVAKVGGMNHFMLPQGSSDSGRYGSFAMELLMNELFKMGATRGTLEAKVFGGGQVIGSINSKDSVGKKNTSFILEYLKTERIALVSKDVLDVYARKVCFLPATGKAMVKRISTNNAAALEAQEHGAAQIIVPPGAGGGSVLLF